MAETNQTQREEELARREALLANKRTKAPAGAGAFCLLQMPVTAGRISG